MTDERISEQLHHLLTSTNKLSFQSEEALTETVGSIIKEVYPFIDPKEQKPKLMEKYLVYRSGGLSQQPHFDILPWFGKYWGVSMYDDPTDEVISYLAFPLYNLQPYAEKQEI